MKLSYRLLISFILSCLLYAGVSAASAGGLFGIDRVSPNLRNGNGDLVSTLDGILGYIIGLFYFIAVIFTIYGGFTILTSAGDEEKVKKGKKIFLYAILGLIVIFLASQVVRWVIVLLSDRNIVWS